MLAHPTSEMISFFVMHIRNGPEAQLFIQAAEAGQGGSSRPRAGVVREASRPLGADTRQSARVSLLPLSPEGAPGLKGQVAEALVSSISRHRHLH